MDVMLPRVGWREIAPGLSNMEELSVDAAAASAVDSAPVSRATVSSPLAS